MARRRPQRPRDPSQLGKLIVDLSVGEATEAETAPPDPATEFARKNHALSVALHYMHYNFCRVHKTLRITPAMAAGVTDHVWSVADIVSMIEAAEPTPAKRGPYKKPTAA